MEEVSTSKSMLKEVDCKVTSFPFSVSGSLQQGQAAVQVLPPAAAPQGPATHQRQEPPRAEERRTPTGKGHYDI